MKKVIGLVLLIALLSGCTPGSDVEVVTDLVSIPSPSHIQEQLSNILQVNATVDVQDIDLRRLSILPCTFQVLNTQAALDLLCSDEKIVSHEMTSTEGLGPNAEQNIYRFKSGAMLICGNTLCCYSTSDAEKLFEIIGDDIETQFSDEDQWHNEFAFMSRQDIEENVLDLCSRFKISAKNMEIRAIDYRAVKGKDQSQKYTWSEVDNFYYVSVFPFCGELPLSSINHGDLADGSYMIGSTIKAIYSEKGLIYWNSNFLFQQTKEPDLGDGIISVYTALKSLAAKYDLLLTSASYTITNIDLVYLPVRTGHNAYGLRPVWQFKLVEDNDEEQRQMYFVNIDATSGKEIR